MNIEKLKREIKHQSRNGRDNMYIEFKDIIELIKGSSKEVRGKERIYINIQAINQLIEAYEQENEKVINDFKERLKVDMPDYKLTRIDEYGYKFEPINKQNEKDK